MAIQNKKKSLCVLVTGTKLVSSEYTVRKARLAAYLFQQQHGIKAERIDGRKIIGHCHHSGRIILEGDGYEVGRQTIPSKERDFTEDILTLKKEVNVWPVKEDVRPRRRKH